MFCRVWRRIRNECLCVSAAGASSWQSTITIPVLSRQQVRQHLHNFCRLLLRSKMPGYGADLSVHVTNIVGSSVRELLLADLNIYIYIYIYIHIYGSRKLIIKKSGTRAQNAITQKCETKVINKYDKCEKVRTTTETSKHIQRIQTAKNMSEPKSEHNKRITRTKNNEHK
jgi:hypothetical protein